ncbi:MAG TPA: ComEC family competence protein [Candidatus Uhrbacteria bacterium]|nr:ComEC family competence protein [Candidatus Uhrbacteria bacterium]
MSYSRIFFYCCCFFILGVFLRSIIEFDFFIAYLILLLAFFFFLLVKKNKYFLVLGFFCLALFLGIFRCQMALPQVSENKIYFYNSQQAEFRGIVSQEPDQREDKVRLQIKTSEIKINGIWQPVSGKVLATNFLYPQYDYGDKLQITCLLRQPETVNDFAYDKYLARYDIYSLCYYPQISLLEKKQGNFILAGIFHFKNHFVSRLNWILPEPQASFLAGLLIGAKKSIPADLAEVFNQTGTTHIIAVSGYNVTIIAVFLMLLAQNLSLSRQKAFWLIILILIIFAIITGLQASIIRASIMGALVLLANYLGRVSNIKNVLALAAVLMLLVNPKVLVYDLGFQLSFLATLGLVYLSPVLIKLTKIENCKLKIVKLIFSDYFITTLSAIILTTPLILYQFGKISLIAPLANILILPFIPIAMLLGFISGLLALIFVPMGQIAGWSVWLVLSYIIWILEKLAGLNWAYFEFEKIGLGLMAVLYLAIFIFIYIDWLKKNKKAPYLF